jgi:2-amino-4-hydroxy-6-hydroxymethyldihydropteridine diphosphokinase
MVAVTLSLGSNIDRTHNIQSGIEALRRAFGEVELSPVYESEAVGFSGEPFFNLVARIQTDLPVGELSDRLRKIEADHGRVRASGKKFSSRTLDIDILTYGHRTGVIDGVALPRDEILKHAFVLIPLVDLVPDDVHPTEGKTFRALLDERQFADQKLWQVELT